MIGGTESSTDEVIGLKRRTGTLFEENLNPMFLFGAGFSSETALKSDRNGLVPPSAGTFRLRL